MTEDENRKFGSGVLRSLISDLSDIGEARATPRPSPSVPQDSIDVDGVEYVSLCEASRRADKHPFDFYDAIKSRDIPSIRINGRLYLCSNHINKAK